MKMLVTGAAGQLGTTIVRSFARSHEVVGLARHELDITQHVRVLDAVNSVRPSVIINCAAYNDVDGAESNPVRAMEVNAFAVRSLAAASDRVGATLVHYSTDFVFDGTAHEPYGEEDAPNPQSVYATSKLIGEWFSADINRHYVVRVESLFGGSALGKGDSERLRGSSLDRMADAMLGGREVRVFVDRTVSPSYVEDVATATRSLLTTEAPFGLYHCVGTGRATWYDVAIELARCFSLEPAIERVRVADLSFRACRPQFCALSNAKLAGVGVGMPTWQDALSRYAAVRIGQASC